MPALTGFCSCFEQGVCTLPARGLEADSQSELHLTRIVPLSVQYAESAGVRQIEKRIEQLVMVEKVLDHELELCGHAFRNPEVLLDAHVHIPVLQAADLPKTACARVDSQNGSTNIREHSCRIREDIELSPRCGITVGIGCECRADTVRTGYTGMRGRRSA